MVSSRLGCCFKDSRRSEGRHGVDTTKAGGVGEGMIRCAGCNACFVDTGPLLFTACQRLAFTRKANNLETGHMQCSSISTI